MFALVAIVGGLSGMVAAGLVHRRSQERALDEVLGMTPVPDLAVPDGEGRALTNRAVDLASQMVVHVDRQSALAAALERAKIPLRPGEFVIVTAAGSLAVAALVLSVTYARPLAVIGAICGPMIAWRVLLRRATKRRRAFEAQLPDALSLVASSLSAGHTFLRSIQMMTEEAAPPLSEEFARVVAETRLGDPVVDALERMAARLQIRDMDMVVQAIRIQQTVGGRLAELLHTLGDFIRARDEVRREVNVLTAEGRMSAYVLTAIVPFMFVVMQVLNPRYVKPLYSGWGLFMLIGCFGSVAIGLIVILRMVKIDL